MYRVITCWIRRVFGFSRTEANGYLVLIALLMIGHFGMTRFSTVGDFNFEDPEFMNSISQIDSSLQDSISIKSKPMESFNPNTVDYDLLISWGLEPKVAANMVKYRKAGGHYSKPEDLKKIFGMTDSIWRALQPWMKFNSRAIKSKVSKEYIQRPNTNKKTDEVIIPKNINEVDSVWLQKIYGIGPVLSKRMVRYRNILGGYYSIEQLKEVYGLPPEVLENLRKNLFVESGSNLVKININAEDYQQIAAHPYISYDQAKAIIAYRDQHGSFKSIEEVKKIHLIDDSTYLRVHPYLDF